MFTNTFHKLNYTLSSKNKIAELSLFDNCQVVLNKIEKSPWRGIFKRKNILLVTIYNQITAVVDER